MGARLGQQHRLTRTISIALFKEWIKKAIIRSAWRGNIAERSIESATETGTAITQRDGLP